MTSDGIGIEVRADRLHAVRLTSAGADVGSRRVVTTADMTLPDAALDDDLVEAFEQIAVDVDAGATPVRLAWFPPAATVKAHEVTGRSPADVEALTGELEAAGVTATTTIDAGDARWLVAVTWDHARATRLAELAGRAGLRVVACEPGPLALARVLPPQPTMARRSGAGATGWQAVAADGVALLAVSTPVVGRHHAELTTTALEAEGEGAAGERPAILFGDQPFLGHPPSDDDAAGRQAVALGAAVAACGLVEPPLPLVPFRPVPPVDRPPWVIERLSDEAPAEARPGWWRRVIARVRRT